MRRLALLMILFLGFLAPARAGDDAKEVQGIITAQMEALGRDDAEAAFAFAAPAIRDSFGAAEVFLLMVRRGYPAVYRHKSAEFGEMREAEGKFAQAVHLLDQNGIAWEALYTLERQADGSLKISGCVLLKAVDGAA